MTLTAVIAIIGAAYAALCALLYLLQDRMLFLPSIPGREVTATPADAGLRFEEVTLAAADGVRLHGWWVPAPGPAAAPGGAGDRPPAPGRTHSAAVDRAPGL